MRTDANASERASIACSHRTPAIAANKYGLPAKPGVRFSRKRRDLDRRPWRMRGNRKANWPTRLISAAGIIRSEEVAMTYAFDAIVVGARCAGSPVAMLLARQGYRVLAVDRASF